MFCKEVKYLFDSLKYIYNFFEMCFSGFLLLFCLSRSSKPNIKIIDW